MSNNQGRSLVAEFIGTMFLLIGVVGSGIMGEALAGGNTAVALLANTIATGAILAVLILVFGAVSGAHFNPAVTLAFLIRREISAGVAAAYVVIQVIAGLLGVLAAHLMFDHAPFTAGIHIRTGPPQWLAEFVATFGLVATIVGCLKWRPDAVPYAVGLFISAGYWFTSSTSFANPAVTIGRTLSDTFAGIDPTCAPMFILMQVVGVGVAVALLRALFPTAS